MKSTQGAGLIGDETFYFRSIILLPIILQFTHSSFVMRNFSAFHASCTVCNVNLSQIIQITNSYSLLPHPHFNQKRSMNHEPVLTFQQFSRCSQLEEALTENEKIEFISIASTAEKDGIVVFIMKGRCV